MHEIDGTFVSPQQPELPAAAPTMLREILPLIGAIPVAGPPAILLAGPWILLAVVLAGPFALLITAAIVLAAAAGVIVALAAAPYVLVRHLRASRAPHAASRPHFHPANPPEVAGRARSLSSVSASGC